MHLLLSGCVTKTSFSNKYFVSTTVRRHSSKLWSLVIVSSMYITTVYPCILSIGNGRFVSFPNFRGLGDKPLGKAALKWLEFSEVFAFKKDYIPDIYLNFSS